MPKKNRYPHPLKPGAFVSRQRIAQIKAHAAGRCVVCGAPQITSHYCLKHAIAARERQRKYVGCKRRFRRCKTYRLASAA